MTSLGHKLKHEARELVPVSLYFFISFQLLALTQQLMLESWGIKASSFAAATITALVVAKVVLIADHVPFLNRFPDKPLVYNIVWKTAIYFAASFVLRYLEHLIHFWRKASDFDEANRRLLDEVVWPHFCGVQLWLLILLLVFCAARELARALGREKMVRMFFGERGV
ncbi:MAG: hypothetical protein IT435_19455 [Phycisphaerales bacterium]|nr:hypothetical protein [Phycisphaerales bacterium]